MTHLDCQYENMRRVVYEDGATFIPVCMTCHRFVKADESVFTGEGGLRPGPNATCKACGRTEMHFEGFM
jgi:hypothetical protein